MSHTRIAVIGAGFAGLGAAIRLRQEGIDDFVVFEKNPDVSALSDLFTVEMIARYIQGKLGSPSGN